MAAEIEKLRGEALEKELQIQEMVVAMYLMGDFNFFPPPEVIIKYQQIAGALPSLRFEKRISGQLPGGITSAIEKVALGINSCFTVINVLNDGGGGDSTGPNEPWQSALVAGKPFNTDRDIERLVVLAGPERNGLWVASTLKFTAHLPKPGEISRDGSDLPLVLQEKNLQSLRRLAEKAEGFFGQTPATAV